MNEWGGGWEQDRRQRAGLAFPSGALRRVLPHLGGPSRLSWSSVLPASDTLCPREGGTGEGGRAGGFRQEHRSSDVGAFRSMLAFWSCLFCPLTGPTVPLGVDICLPSTPHPKLSTDAEWGFLCPLRCVRP